MVLLNMIFPHFPPFYCNIWISFNQIKLHDVNNGEDRGQGLQSTGAESKSLALKEELMVEKSIKSLGFVCFFC